MPSENEMEKYVDRLTINEKAILAAICLDALDAYTASDEMETVFNLVSSGTLTSIRTTLDNF